jgi:hypothetical protein
MRYIFPIILALALACGSGATPDPVSGDAQTAVPDLPPPALGPIDTFPIAVGDTWRWQVTRHVGAGLRVFLLPTRPATDEAIATFDLTIDSVEGSGVDAKYHATLTRTPKEGLPAKTDLVLWKQGAELWMNGPKGPTPALTVEVPPEPVASEKANCVAVFLGGVPSECSPSPGGPLAIPPGPVSGVVSREDDHGKTIAQVLVGISTAGMFIPGNSTATEYLALVEYKPASQLPTDPVVERWRANPTLATLPAAMPSALNREQAAAIVALAADEERTDVTADLVARVPATDRSSLVRLAMQLDASSDARLKTLARLLPQLTPTPDAAHADPLLKQLEDGDQALARDFLAGRLPVLRAVVAAPVGGENAALEAAIPTTPSLDPREAELALRRCQAPDQVLDRVIAKTPAAAHATLLTVALEGADDDATRDRLLSTHDAVVASQFGDGQAMTSMLKPYADEDRRRAVIEQWWKRTSPADHPRLLIAGSGAMSFDEARLTLLDGHLADAKAMSAADQEALLATFAFEADKARARLGR